MLEYSMRQGNLTGAGSPSRPIVPSSLATSNFLPHQATVEVNSQK